MLNKRATDVNNAPTLGELQNNTAIFEKIFKNWFTPLCSHCQYKFGFDLEVAKDTVHTAFIKLWENRGRLPPDVCLKNYLYKTISNSCLDLLKHQKVKQKHMQFVMQNTFLDEPNSDFDVCDLKQLQIEIDKAVSELPEQMRRIFELSRYEGLKYREIASFLDISVKTVETQISRALIRLRQKLGQYTTLAFLALLTNM